MALHFFTWGKGTERRLYGAQRVVQTSVPVQANAFHIQCLPYSMPCYAIAQYGKCSAERPPLNIRKNGSRGGLLRALSHYTCAHNMRMLVYIVNAHCHASKCIDKKAPQCFLSFQLNVILNCCSCTAKLYSMPLHTNATYPILFYFFQRTPTHCIGMN